MGPLTTSFFQNNNMTLDSAIVTKDFGNPSIVRPRPINIQMGADGKTSTDDTESAPTSFPFSIVGIALIGIVFIYTIKKL